MAEGRAANVLPLDVTRKKISKESSVAKLFVNKQGQILSTHNRSPPATKILRGGAGVGGSVQNLSTKGVTHPLGKSKEGKNYYMENHCFTEVRGAANCTIKRALINRN